MGVAWDLSCAVPKPAKIKRIKLVTIRPWKHNVPERKNSEPALPKTCVLGFKILTFPKANY